MGEPERVRSFCFVVNNYTATCVEQVNTLMNSVFYGCYAYEVGELCGTPHIQGYVYLKDAKTMKAMSKKVKRAAWKVCSGTAEDNRRYIFGPYEKDGKVKPTNPTAVEFGNMPHQGARGDLVKIKEEILAGKKVDDIVLEAPVLYHMYGRTLTKIEDLRMRKVFRQTMTLGEWIFGGTGTGKSMYAFKDFNPDTHYVWKYDNGWNDGYAQQDIVIIDEFRGQMPMNELLTMIDCHPNYYVKRRNREPLPFTSKKVIITSSQHPREIYHNLAASDKLEQLLRRIKILEF